MQFLSSYYLKFRQLNLFDFNRNYKAIVFFYCLIVNGLWCKLFKCLKSLYLQLNFFWCRIWLSTDRSLMAWFSSHLLGKDLLFPCIVTDFSKGIYICKTNHLLLMVCRLFVCYWLLLIRRTCIWSKRRGQAPYCSSFEIFKT